VTLQPTPTVSVMGKGRKQRSLPLWKQTAADIRAWLAVRDQSSAPELFHNCSIAPQYPSSGNRRKSFTARQC
jgi:site-specific recombinase XerC